MIFYGSQRQKRVICLVECAFRHTHTHTHSNNRQQHWSLRTVVGTWSWDPVILASLSAQLRWCGSEQGDSCRRSGAVSWRLASPADVVVKTFSWGVCSPCPSPHTPFLFACTATHMCLLYMLATSCYMMNYTLMFLNTSGCTTVLELQSLNINGKCNQ